MRADLHIDNAYIHPQSAITIDTLNPCCAKAAHTQPHF